jgi:hypothetical protein
MYGPVPFTPLSFFERQTTVIPTNTKIRNLIDRGLFKERRE